MKSWHTVPLAALAVAAATVVPRGAQSQFTPSDPVVSEADIYDASGVRPTDASTERMRLAAAFARSSDAPCGVTSANSIGEVPDGSWFVNRIGTTRLSPADVARGPNRLQESLTGPWTVVAAKTDGVTPGLRMKDRAGRVFYVKFDPPKFPELASGAEVVATKLLWAAGYWVPENYIVRFRPAELTLAPDATFKGPDGVPRPITSRDVDWLLATAARTPDGSYRVVASLRIPGQPLGPFQYSGVRPDDPNDWVPHECRRELRGLRVFAAWLNHVDTKPGNTLDSLAPTGSIKVVRHFLLDFGSTLGSAGTQPKDWRDGFEYAADGRTAVLALATFGLHTPPWLHAEFPVLPSIGRIESRYFQPDTWKPTLANPAFQRADEDDAFWAARKVIAFSDDLIRAAVASGEYSDPAAARYLADVLIARRDAIARTWISNVNPIANPRIAPDGRLTFDNVAAEARVASDMAEYRIRWALFDNTTRTTSPLGLSEYARVPHARVPSVPASAAFVVAEIAALHPKHPEWARPVRVFLRRSSGEGWSVVGFERPGRHAQRLSGRSSWDLQSLL